MGGKGLGSFRGGGGGGIAFGLASIAKNQHSTVHSAHFEQAGVKLINGPCTISLSDEFGHAPFHSTRGVFSSIHVTWVQF